MPFIGIQSTPALECHGVDFKVAGSFIPPSPVSQVSRWPSPAEHTGPLSAGGAFTCLPQSVTVSTLPAQAAVTCHLAQPASGLCIYSLRNEE